MPLHQTLLIFIVSLAAAVALAGGSQALRADLRRPRLWLAVLTVAALVSLGSAVIVGETRHAGTGFTTSHGWPKPFYFRYLAETGARTRGFSALYFIGATLAYAGPLLVLWSILRRLRR